MVSDLQQKVDVSSQMGKMLCSMITQLEKAGVTLFYIYKLNQEKLSIILWVKQDSQALSMCGQGKQDSEALYG